MDGARDQPWAEASGHQHRVERLGAGGRIGLEANQQIDRDGAAVHAQADRLAWAHTELIKTQGGHGLAVGANNGLAGGPKDAPVAVLRAHAGTDER